MYEWRQMTPEKREEILCLRYQIRVPWHSPPHYAEPGVHYYHLAGACYEHAPFLGRTPERMANFELQLQTVLAANGNRLAAWCILPNHWHALVCTGNLVLLLPDVGKLHGKTSFEWNREENQSSRKCWHRCSDRRIRSDAHLFAVMNYIHHNPVKHGYVHRWEAWPFSSAAEFLEKEGRERALTLWNDYPVGEMGSGWDD